MIRQEIILIAALLLISCGTTGEVGVSLTSPVLPVLTGKEFNPVQKIALIRQQPGDYTLEKVVLSLKGTTDIGDITKVTLFGANEKGLPDTGITVGEAVLQGTMATFTDHFPVTGDTLTLWVTVTLKEEIDLTHRIGIQCSEIVTDKGRLRLPDSDAQPLRTGVTHATKVRVTCRDIWILPSTCHF